MNILDAEKRRVIAAQVEVVEKERFFLAGGTVWGFGSVTEHDATAWRFSRDRQRSQMKRHSSSSEGL